MALPTTSCLINLHLLSMSSVLCTVQSTEDIRGNVAE